MGLTVGETTFTDQDYADDAVLFTDDPSRPNWTQILMRFDADAQTMGLHKRQTPKRRLWNDCSHPRTYRSLKLLTALHTWAVTSAHAVVPHRRCSDVLVLPQVSPGVGQLTSVWQQSRLSLHTKLRLYDALVVSVLLYGAEIWTLTKSDEQKLQSFQMSCLRQILGIRWFDFVPNVPVMNQTQQQCICNRIRDRQISIFGHVCRLQVQGSVPVHGALRLVVNTRAGHRPDDRPEWKRSRGRPR